MNEPTNRDRAKRDKYCGGCENNFYNGNNQYGVKVCWSLKDAKTVLKKEVPIHQVPPWNQKPRRVLTCFHRKGYAQLDRDTQ